MTIKSINIQAITQKTPQSLISKSLMVALLALASQQALANETVRSQSKSGFYFGLGGAHFALDPVTVRGKEYKSGTGLYASIGMTYPLPWHENLYVDGKIGFGTRKNTSESGFTCSTTFGTQVGCDVVGNTNIINIPVTINYRVPVSETVSVNFGAGAALNSLSRSIDLEASGYQSKNDTEKRWTGASAAAQTGISYNKWRLNLSANLPVGNKKVGSGSVAMLEIQYGSGF